MISKKKKSKNKWISPDIHELMKKDKKVTDRYSYTYKILDKEIKRKCIEAKESWLDIQCKEIEQAKERTSHLYVRR